MDEAAATRSHIENPTSRKMTEDIFWGDQCVILSFFALLA